LYRRIALFENRVFRDTRQDWCLEHPPRKTKEGVWVQVDVVMAMKALSNAFLMWQEEQARFTWQESKPPRNWTVASSRFSSATSSLSSSVLPAYPL
jgi:hypothetical protein